MSLTSTSYDAGTLYQQTADARNLYAYQVDPIVNYRPFPGPQAPGVTANILGSGQKFVDAESMLRNQSFLPSQNTQFRQQADQQFASYMQQPQSLTCISSDLTPIVSYNSRSCDPMSGTTIDRFDPLIVSGGAGFQYGMSASTFGVDTVAAAKDQIQRQ